MPKKPSVARDIAPGSSLLKKADCYIEGSDYIVTWALGHLVTLADPKQYGEQYKTWNMDTLPMLPEEWKLVVIRQTGKQFQGIKELIYRKDVSDIIIATDAGREGELVARWILDKAANKKTAEKTLDFFCDRQSNSGGFRQLKARGCLLQSVQSCCLPCPVRLGCGINATRALTCKYNAQLSCGRVQTPTLSMLAARKVRFVLLAHRISMG